MTKQELISKLQTDAKGTPLEPVCLRAAQVLEASRETKIVIGEGGLPAEQVVKIAQRRLSRLTDLGEKVTGLEESLNTLRTMVGNLRAAYAETDDAMIQFWLGDQDGLVGCVIGAKAA